MPSANITATYSPEDNKLRLYAASRLDSETYERVKASGFKWAPKQELFVAPMWTPDREDLCMELAGEIGDEDMSLVERAEAKAERLEDLSERRAEESAQAHATVKAITDHIPFGQPILVGHHSERRARKDAERIERAMDKAVANWKAAEYWSQRAKGALRHAKYKERPDVRARRIKGLESDLRKCERNQSDAEKTIKIWETLHDDAATIIKKKDGGATSFQDRARYVAGRTNTTSMDVYFGLDKGTMTPEEAQRQTIQGAQRVIAANLRWIEHYTNRIAYERAMLDDAGGLVAEQQEIAVGGRVLVRGEWVTVLRVTKREGRVLSVRTTARYCSLVSAEEISGYEPPSAEQATATAEHMKQGPLCNYPGEGFQYLTEEQYKAAPSDYRGYRDVAATETTGAHRVRRIYGVWLPREIKAALLEGITDSTARTNAVHKTFLVFLTDAKRKDPPAKTPATPDTPAPVLAPSLDLPTLERRADRVRAHVASLDALADSHFEHSAESGKIRAGIKWISRTDGPGCPGECYQFDTLADVLAHARAFQGNEDILSFSLVTHTGQYQNMRTVYKWDRLAEELAGMAEQLKTGQAVKVVVAPQLFATSGPLAERVVEEADIQPGMRVLDPSVGTGNLAYAAFNRAPIEIVAVELNGKVLEMFTQRYTSWGNSRIQTVHGDFLQQNGNLGKFDRIVMNPPFRNGDDIKHIQHAVHMLKPGGRLVALCANGPRQQAILKPMAENSGGKWEALPAGSFAAQGTNVNSALLVIKG